MDEGDLLQVPDRVRDCHIREICMNAQLGFNLGFDVSFMLPNSIAEIERLEVVAGTPINYDWAVGAVMEALRNHFPDTTTDLPYVVDPSLQLSANSLNLLSNT